MDTWSGRCRGVLDINDPCYIVTSSRGRNIIVDCDLTIKVFDNRGKFENVSEFQLFLLTMKNKKQSLKSRLFGVHSVHVLTKFHLVNRDY